VALSLFSMLLVVELGVHRVLIGYLLETYRIFPVGGHAAISNAMPEMVALSGKILEVGVRLAMPVIAIGLAVQAVLALLARAAPSLQIFNVGLPVMVVTGVMALFVSLRTSGSG
jgi:flagellar biosynthetic protein FliR